MIWAMEKWLVVGKTYIKRSQAHTKASCLVPHQVTVGQTNQVLKEVTPTTLLVQAVVPQTLVNLGGRINTILHKEMVDQVVTGLIKRKLVGQVEELLINEAKLDMVREKTQDGSKRGDKDA